MKCYIDNFMCELYKKNVNNRSTACWPTRVWFLSTSYSHLVFSFVIDPTLGKGGWGYGWVLLWWRAGWHGGRLRRWRQEPRGDTCRGVPTTPSTHFFRAQVCVDASPVTYGAAWRSSAAAVGAAGWCMPGPPNDESVCSFQNSNPTWCLLLAIRCPPLGV
jgi:hypothetical protein